MTDIACGAEGWMFDDGHDLERTSIVVGPPEDPFGAMVHEVIAAPDAPFSSSPLLLSSLGASDGP